MRSGVSDIHVYPLKKPQRKKWFKNEWIAVQGLIQLHAGSQGKNSFLNKEIILLTHEL